MTTNNPPREPLTDSDLIALAIRFVLGILKSADSKVIGAKRWWDRAKTSLETAASVAESWPQMASKAGEKLQITSPSAVTALVIADLGSKLGTDEEFERFRYLCQRDALYIVAMARAAKEESKEEKKNAKD
jgi:hypothetical protein